MADEIILVDRDDREIGSGEKTKVHEEGRLHRAFSIFVFNQKGELLLQRRAKSKYHSGGLWTNTVCSHPRVGESLETAVHRRLKEEMGFDVPLKEAFSFIYKARLDRGLTEHELDHVFFGNFDGTPRPSPEEADGWKWASLGELRKDVQEHPESYTYWFRVSLERVISSRKNL